MSTTLATTLNLILSHTFTNVLDLASPVESFRLDAGDTLANGTGSSQADVVWHDTRTLAATSENLDLAGSLTNSYGTTVTFAKVKGIFIHNKATTTAFNLTVGAAASAAWATFLGATHTAVIGPDGILLAWNPIDGYAVTATTADILKINAGSNSVTYDIWIVGTSA